MKTRFLVCSLLLAACLNCCASASAAPADTSRVAEVMKSTWDRPDAPLTVEPIVIDGDYAMAGWAQGERGGRALLKRKDGAWRVHVCGGDGLKSAATIETAGVPKATAKRLSAKLARAEAKTAPALLRKFSTFEGVVPMDSHDHAPHSAHEKK
jgi:hypothetical protein